MLTNIKYIFLPLLAYNYLEHLTVLNEHSLGRYKRDID